MRALVVGGGERALDLAGQLVAEGHAVRMVTRHPSGARRAAIESVGAECWPGDPDRIGTIRGALEHVTVLLWLLGTATGDPEKVAALHGSRLKMMLEKTTDSTVRGVVYENAGPVEPAVLAAGLSEVRWANRANEIPYALVEADPCGDRAAWTDAVRAAISSLLTPVRA